MGTKEYLYKVGDIVNKLEILEHIRIETKRKNKDGKFSTIKGYAVKCLKCGEVNKKAEYTLTNGSGCYCNVGNGKHQYKIGDIINGLEIVATTTKEVKSRDKTINPKAYKVKCGVDSYEFTTLEENLKKGRGCPVCANKIDLDGGKKYLYKIGDIVNGLEIIEKTMKKIGKKDKRINKAYKVKCTIDGSEHIFTEEFLKHGGMCKTCSHKKSKNIKGDYNHNIGDIVNGLEILDFIIFNRIARGENSNVKGYSVRCTKDNYTYDTSENNLSNGGGCPVCANRKILKGVNDVSTTHPSYLKYFVDIEDAYSVSYSSNKKVLLKCPECGEKRNIPIQILHNQGFYCKKCSDGISIPNKFIYNLLSQLNVKFDTEKIFDWSKKKRYDAFIYDINCIVEMHGEQHYLESSRGRSLKEEQENDAYKKTLAKENNIDHYIVIDSRYSNLQFLKENIMQSKLLKLLNVKEYAINWDDIWTNCQKSEIKIVADLWNEENTTTKNISDITGFSKSVIVKWLKRANECGFCNYDCKVEFEKGRSRGVKKISKKVRCITNKRTYESISSASRLSNVSQAGISKCCSGKRNYAGKLPDGTPLVWEYI